MLKINGEQILKQPEMEDVREVCNTFSEESLVSLENVLENERTVVEKVFFLTIATAGM